MNSNPPDPSQLPYGTPQGNEPPYQPPYGQQPSAPGPSTAYPPTQVYGVDGDMSATYASYTTQEGSGYYNPQGMYNPQASTPFVGGPINPGGPVNPGGPGYPPPPPPSKGVSNRTMTIIIVSIVGLIMASLIVTVLLWQPWKSDTTPTDGPTSTTVNTSKPTTSTSANGTLSPTTQPSATTSTVNPSQVDCNSGGGDWRGGIQTTETTANVTFTVSSTWGFRFDRSQWPWLINGRASGREVTGTNAHVGLIVGGLNMSKGFGSPEFATERIQKCMMTYGIYNDDLQTVTQTASAPATIDGMPGHRREYNVKSSDPKNVATTLTVIALDAGYAQTDQRLLTTVVGFVPVGDATAAAELKSALESLKKG